MSRFPDDYLQLLFQVNKNKKIHASTCLTLKNWVDFWVGEYSELGSILNLGVFWIGEYSEFGSFLNWVDFGVGEYSEFGGIFGWGVFWIVARRARATGGRPEAGEATAGGGSSLNLTWLQTIGKKNVPPPFDVPSHWNKMFLGMSSFPDDLQLLFQVNKTSKILQKCVHLFNPCLNLLDPAKSFF